MKNLSFLFVAIFFLASNTAFGQTVIFNNTCESNLFPLTDWSGHIKNKNKSNHFYRLKDDISVDYVISEEVNLTNYTNVSLITEMKDAGNSPTCLIAYTTDGGTSWNTLSSHTLSTTITDYPDAVNLTNPSVRFRWSISNGDGSTNLVITNIKLTGTLNTPKSVNTITYNQASTSDVSPNSSDNEILRIDIDVTGNTGTLNLNSLEITALNTTDADIAASGVKLYRTTTTTFSTSNQLGTAQSLSGGSPSGGTATFSSLSYDLPTGTTYIWAVYDIANTATDGNTVDMKIAATGIDIGGSTYPSSEESPAGERIIVFSGITWVGGTNNNWNDATNWSTGVLPSSNDNVVIPNGSTVNVLDGDNNNGNGKLFARDLTIASGATLNFDGKGILEIYGDLFNEGTIDMSSSTRNIVLKGSSKSINGSGTFTKIGLRPWGGDYTLNIDLPDARNIATSNGGIFRLGTHAIATSAISIRGAGDQIITNGTIKTDSFPHSEGSLTCGVNSTIEFESNSIKPRSYPGKYDYNNIVFSGTATKSFDADVNIKGSWTNNGGFDAGTTTVTFNGTAGQTITGSASTTFYDITLDNSAGLTISKTANISHALTLTSGIINTTSANLVVFESSATVSGGSNTAHINGPVQKDGTSDFVFPTGDAGKYARIGISALSGTDNFTAEYHKAKPTNNTSFTYPITKVSDNEYWQLDRAGSSVTATVTLYWEDSKWSGIGSFPDLRIMHYGSSSWTAESGTYTNSGSADLSSSVAGSISVSGVSNFSPFSFGTIDNVKNTLPIELLSFTAKAVGNEVLVNWQTASEQDNDYFIVERSIDGVNAEHIATVKGAGNSNEVLDYHFVDQNPYSGTSYYRLTQVDYNGQSETFDWVAVNFDQKEAPSVMLYPNPVSNANLNINFHNLKGQTTLNIYDISGKLVYQEELNIADGDQTRALHINLSQGIYNVQLINNDNVVIKRLIVK